MESSATNICDNFIVMEKPIGKGNSGNRVYLAKELSTGKVKK